MFIRVYLSRALRVLMMVSNLGSFLGLPAGICLLMACACLLLARGLGPLNWFCFFSINIGAICSNLVERKSLISWNWIGLSRVSSSDKSFAMEAFVLLNVLCRSSIRESVSSVLHFLMALDQASFKMGFLVLLMLNLKSTLEGYWFLASLPSITLMEDAKDNFFL